MNKKFCMLLTLTFLMSLFGGCASESSIVSESAVQEQTQSVSESASGLVTDQSIQKSEPVLWPENPLGSVELPLTEEPVTVSFWFGVNPSVLEITNDIGQDCAIWSQLAERTGVNLEFIPIHPSAQNEQFSLMVASDDLADIITGAADLYTNGGEAAIADEVLIDHLPYLTEELTPQICKIMEQYPDAIKEALTDSGYLAGMPGFSMQTDTTQTFGWLIRQDWLDELNLPTPETYDDLYNTLVAFRDKMGADAALILNCGGTGIYNGLVQGYEINANVENDVTETPFYQVNDQVMFGPIQPEYKEYLSMVNKWYEEGLIWQDFMSNNDYQNPPTDLILDDRTGVFYGEVTHIAILENTTSDPNMKLVAIPDFVKSKGDTISFQSETEYVASVPWSISTQCECPELLMQWCNYMYTDEGALFCNYGIEGESFNFDDNGQPVFTDLVLNNPTMSTTVALFMYCMDRGPFYRDDTREYSGYTQAQKEASGIWKSNLSVGRSMGTTALNTEESELVNRFYGDINTYVSENVLNFIVGNTDLSEFDEYVAHILDMGIEDVVAAYQSAYERYLSGETTEPVTAPGPPPEGEPAP